MFKSIPVFQHIKDAYRFLNVPTDSINLRSEFVIHDMRDAHTALPSQSPVFRANYFSFVFVKNAVGHSMIKRHPFDVLSGTIYFTNPGHITSFS